MSNIISVLSEQLLFHKLYNKVSDVSILSTDFFFIFFFFFILIERFQSVAARKLFPKLFS